MRKKPIYLFFPLIIFLFFTISLPFSFTEKIRYQTVSFVSPIWKEVASIGTVFKNSGDKQSSESAKIAQLTLENQRLHSQIDAVREWLLFDGRIQEQTETMQKLFEKTQNNHYWNEFFRRRGEELLHLLEVQLQSLPAKIIFREPQSWNSSVWIDIGERENEALGRTIVAKNSPVVVGDSLVGVVEVVGKTQSRVRLITDRGLVASVRAVRGFSSDSEIAKIAITFLERMHDKDHLFYSEEEKNTFHSTLNNLVSRLLAKKEDWYLAKGEIYGASLPLFQSNNQTLRGVGFNYDYGDKEGPARDLRLGSVVGDFSFSLPKMPIIQARDLLVTSGLDGVFPAGLYVARVTKIFPLKEGDYTYEIEAKPTADNIDELNLVFVMPPLDYQK